MRSEPMVPRCLASDPEVRPAYRAGVWSYAIGRPAIEHARYDEAVKQARKERWDWGWIRTWQDVAAVLNHGCRFHQAKALANASFFPTFLTLRKGRYAGQPFRLIDYQKYDVIMPLYGWQRPDGLQRFSSGSMWMPKKNAKSAVCSGIGLRALVAGGVSPEVICVAGDKKQAGIIHGEGAKMARANPALRKHLRFVDSQKTIVCEFNDGVFQAIGADAALAEGLHPNTVLYDEIHIQKNRVMYDTLVGALIASINGLFFSLSTSGVYNANSIGWEVWEENRAVREGLHEDFTYLAVAYFLGKDRDWKNPDNHVIANPGLGITFPRENFDKIFAAALRNPAKQNQFRRYHLNQWLQQAERYIDINLWEKCDMPVIEREMEGRRCFGGFDGAGKYDLNSQYYTFPPEDPEDPDGKVVTIGRNWVPRACIEPRSREDKVPYDEWATQWYLTALPGESVDQRYCVKQIIEDSKKFQIVEQCFDPAWGRAIEGPLLDEGIVMVEFKQNMQNYTAALDELLSLLRTGKFVHGNDPVLRFAADNLVVRTNANKEMRPDKQKATERIDPIVAVLMGIARMIVHRGEKRSIYEDEKPAVV